jgi:lipoprotein NlpI
MEKEKEIEELEDELRPEYDFAQRQGGIRGKYVQRYQLAQEEEPILQVGKTYEVWSPFDSHEAAHKLAQLLELE